MNEEQNICNYNMIMYSIYIMGPNDNVFTDTYLILLLESQQEQKGRFGFVP